MVPGSTPELEVCSEFTEEDLDSRLETANEQFAEDPQVALFHTVGWIRGYLVCQGVREEHLKIFDKLVNGLEDLGNGLRSEISQSSCDGLQTCAAAT